MQKTAQERSRMMEPYGFFAMLSRMKYISRWGLMRNSRTENLSEHTLETAYFAHALALIEGADPARVVLCALYHDCSEILTGDLPTPVKYHNPAIKESYKAIEEAAAGRLLATLPSELAERYRPCFFEEDPQVRRLVKAADKLSALVKCIEEIRMGNNDFLSARESQLAALREMGIPAVDIFLREYLPAFDRTLDEISR
ncbi:5'-deoxynucleotidase [Anaerotruncus massiliensis (ex Togo et al. 2019)]|uniref:5'-deoxynucleotidase n=1 Tax=Anaerotruncus massiliensis (ex Togo et al. 2019) TaxID=1673720 RepID=UPI0027B9F763|nr:5'-deoxynucleotidase [Anaerotruncus massiliensis (ex Togo et al. 2019)]